MNFPQWANRVLIDWWQRTDTDFNILLSGKFSPDELKTIAERNDFVSWMAMRETVTARQNCLERLLRHDEARLAWEWVASGERGDELIHRTWRQIENAMNNWDSSPRMTTGEYKEDILEITKLAEKLARKLAVHRGGEFSYSAIIPEKYRGSIETSLHPDMVEQLKNGSIRPILAINTLFPPVHVLIKQIASTARTIEPPKNRPRKIHSETAFEIFLMNRLAPFLLGNGVRFSSTNMARLISVVLDDESITDDNIRMNAGAQDWWEWTKDSPNF